MDSNSSARDSPGAVMGTGDFQDAVRVTLDQAQSVTALEVETDTAVAERDPPQTQLPKQKTKKQALCNKHGKRKDKCCSANKGKKRSKEESTTEESNGDSSDSDSSDSSDSESDEDEQERRRRKKKALKRKERKKEKAKARAKAKKRKSRKYDSSSDDSESTASDTSDTSESESEHERRRRKRKSRKASKAEESSSEEDSAEATPDATAPVDDDIDTQMSNLRTQLAQLQMTKLTQATTPQTTKKKSKTQKKREKKPSKRVSTLEYKRVDQVWDRNIYNYKFTESAEKEVNEFDEFVFVVRRKFDWENKYSYTKVDVKSKPLRDALQQVMKDVKGVSLVEESPSIDPNMLFLYLEELKTYYRKTLKAQLKKEKKKKIKKRLSQQISHCKILAAYLDEDYEDTKKSLYPMLKAGNITFDLLWALFKPNTIAFTPTYGSTEDPRCFKVDYANKERHPLRGEWYSIEGRYLEYDGKVFGLGDLEVHVEAFKGPRKITSLATYPLQYHKDPEGVKKQLVERGKKFVGLQGMNYRFHKGLAYQKKKKAVAKVNINGRVMVDPAIFRRVCPNYPISYIKRREDDDSPNSQDDSDDECSECCPADSESDTPGAEAAVNLSDESGFGERTKVKVFVDKNDQVHVIHVPVDEDGNEVIAETLEAVDRNDESACTFSEEELLIASPVVLGFAFSEKLWLEFSLSGIKDIEWNNEAFSSLVLHKHIKQNLKGLVSSHKFHAAKTIDDVIQGKGKGLNVVLHGPPGVGKTLTAESIAEYLKCPLYAVSAGELGTDSRMLEAELNKIMDITHSWGAILLLDEADVFLEKREVHDIHRNALVSIFLRLLEYYQGILFLTTNRVETFDEAFQSRIHMAIRYENLTRNARKEVWTHHVGSVRKMEGQESEPFEKEHFDELSKKVLNGRQIKNAVKTAQSIALAEEDAFSMDHIKRVLDVAEDFDADLRGGNGYRDAMRQYT